MSEPRKAKSAQAFAMVPNGAVLDHDLPLPALRFLCIIAIGRDSESGWTRMGSERAAERMGYKSGADRSVIGRLAKVLLERGYIDYLPGRGGRLSRYRVIYDQPAPTQMQMELEDTTNGEDIGEGENTPQLGLPVRHQDHISTRTGSPTYLGPIVRLNSDWESDTVSRLSLKTPCQNPPYIPPKEPEQIEPGPADRLPPKSEQPLPPSDTPPASETNQAKPKRQRKAKLNTAALAVDFAAFYQAYPLKKDRLDAEQAYATARNSATHETIMAGLARFEFSADPKYQKYPAGWLRKRRWEDEPTPALAADPWGLNAWLAGPNAPKAPTEKHWLWTYQQYTEVMGDIGLPETWRGDLAILGRWSEERFDSESVQFVLRQWNHRAYTGISQVAGVVDQWAKRYVNVPGRAEYRIPDEHGRGFNEGQNLPRWLERRAG
jgi:hypothetical protein